MKKKSDEKLVEINIHNAVLSSFPVLDVFVKVAAHLARNGSMDVIGRSFTDLKELTGVRPVIHESGRQLIGSVIYIDNFGNVVTNIKKSLFLEVQNPSVYYLCAKCKV